VKVSLLMVNTTVKIVEPGKQEILFTKELNASMDIVFKTSTDSKLDERLLELKRFRATSKISTKNWG
jgi:hypothetical protein